MSSKTEIFQNWLAAQPRANGNVGLPLFTQAATSDNNLGTGVYPSKTMNVLIPNTDPLVPGQLVVHSRQQEWFNGVEITEVPELATGIFSLAFSTEGNFLAVHYTIDTAPGVIWIYEVINTNGVLSLDYLQELSYEFSNTVITFIADDRFLILNKGLAGEDSEGSVLAYRKNAGEEEFTEASPALANSAGASLTDVVSMMVSPDNKHVILNATSNVYLYEVLKNGIRYLSKLSTVDTEALYWRSMAFISNTELIGAMPDGIEVEAVPYDLMVRYRIVDGLIRMVYQFGSLSYPAASKLIPLKGDIFIGLYPADPSGYHGVVYRIIEIVDGETITYGAEELEVLLDESSNPLVFSSLLYNPYTEMLYGFGADGTSQMVLDLVGDGFTTLVSSTAMFSSGPIVLLPATHAFYSIDLQSETFYLKAVYTEFSGAQVVDGILHPDSVPVDSYWIGFAIEEIDASPRTWSVQSIMKIGVYPIIGP